MKWQSTHWCCDSNPFHSRRFPHSQYRFPTFSSQFTMAILRSGLVFSAAVPFRFRSLPQEIQLQIVQCLRWCKIQSQRREARHGILLLDKSTYLDFAPLFYQTAVFHLPQVQKAHDLGSSLNSLTSLCLDNIKHIELRWERDQHQKWPGHKSPKRLLTTIETLVEVLRVTSRLPALEKVDLLFEKCDAFGFGKTTNGCRMFGFDSLFLRVRFMSRQLNGIPGDALSKLEEKYPQLRVTPYTTATVRTPGAQRDVKLQVDEKLPQSTHWVRFKGISLTLTNLRAAE